MTKFSTRAEAEDGWGRGWYVFCRWPGGVKNACGEWVLETKDFGDRRRSLRGVECVGMCVLV